jgi:hypothetical protein
MVFLDESNSEPRKEVKQMNTKSQDVVCATSDTQLTWHGIDWAECHSNVRRLQARIVKATKEGRWNKVKALQWLLTHSLSGKAIAVKRVTENQGKKTPGVDRETWDTPVAKMAGLLSLKRRGYRAQPLRRVHIPKASGGQRPTAVKVFRKESESRTIVGKSREFDKSSPIRMACFLVFVSLKRPKCRGSFSNSQNHKDFFVTTTFTAVANARWEFRP